MVLPRPAPCQNYEKWEIDKKRTLKNPVFRRDLDIAWFPIVIARFKYDDSAAGVLSGIESGDNSENVKTKKQK